MENILKKTAFTLMEVLITMGIFTLIAAASYSVLLSSNLSSSISEIQIESNASARIALERIIQELQLSQPNKVWLTSNTLGATTSSVLGNVVNFQVPVITNGDLSFNAGQLKWGSQTTEGEYIAYSVKCSEGKCQLLRSIYTSSNGSNPQEKVVAQDIVSLWFKKSAEAPNLITMEITAQGKVSGKPYTHTLRSAIRLKNY